MKTLILSAAASLLALTHIFAQGNLIPPGPPAPMMKTLDQIEPRVDVATLPGDATNQFIISAPGSYYLTGNITGVSGKNGIAVLASNVTVNLNGFALIGVTGTLAGIQVPAAIRNLALQNGTVRDWKQTGIAALPATRSQFTNLRITDNTSIGFIFGGDSSVIECMMTGNGVGMWLAGGNNTIRSCTVNANGAWGIYVPEGSGGTISGCTTSGNGSEGISVVNGACTISNCTSNNNGDGGIFTGPGSTVQGCTTAGNEGSGIHAGFASTVSGCTSRGNRASGIRVANACQVTGNTCDANTGVAIGETVGAGIHAPGDTCRIDGNSVTANKIGIAAAPGNLIIRNSARANTTANYSISGSSTYGPIVTGSGLITETSPWANFSY